MTCLHRAEMFYFLDNLDVALTLTYPFVTVWSEVPLLYVWTGWAFCAGGVAV